MPSTYFICDRKLTLPCKSIILFIFLIFIQISNATDDQSQEIYSKNLGTFANNLYQQLVISKPGENLIFSPFSIQTCLAMARIGADGETAQELDQALGLVSNNVETIAHTFHNVLSKYEDSKILKIANKIYVMKGNEIKKEYNEIVSKQFFSIAEEINFAQNVAAARTINDWVASKTNNLIKEVITEDAIGFSTRLILLNAIHFKGTWVHKFPERATQMDDFYVNDVDTVKVPMMNLRARFLYADLPELDATALEMPYKDTDLSMLIILPNQRNGLKSLEQKLQNVTISDITTNMEEKSVIVKLPKFKTELSIDLDEPLKKMGISRMFTNKANFSKMLKSDEPLEISKVIHKAFIEVNEEGTEAAAVTALRIMPVLFFKRKRFIVNHPFIFTIKSDAGLPFFIGKLSKPNVIL